MVKLLNKFYRSSIIIFFAFMSLLFPFTVDAKTIIVGIDHPTIGNALKKAKDGDVIEVHRGEYREKLRIGKAVHLRGINNPVIVGQEGYIIEVANRGVTIEGFTIKDENPSSDLKSAGIYISKGADGAVILGNRLYNVMYGIMSAGSSGIKIENNIVEGRKNLDRNFRGNGIHLKDSHGAHITGNKLNYCRDGIYIERSGEVQITGNEVRESRYAIHTMWVDRSVFRKNTAVGNLLGIAVMYSKQSEIKDNISIGNKTDGLFLIQAAMSKIDGNTIIGNARGIYFYSSLFNSLTSNLIMDNSVGLYSWGGSEDNTVNENSFISNEVQVKLITDKDQQWDHNYWSDYLGWDMNGDGIGDLPYESNSAVDRILWKYPAAKLLYSSASFQLLWVIEKQFTLLKAPRVLDNRPSMTPLQKNWKELRAGFPLSPERYNGEIEKSPPTH